MPFWDKFMTDVMIYWSPAVVNGYGDEVFSAPCEIAGAYVEKNEVFVRKNGKEDTSRALFQTNVLTKVDGYILFGEIADYTSEQLSDPRNIIDSFRIARVDVSKNLKTGDKYVKGYL